MQSGCMSVGSGSKSSVYHMSRSFLHQVVLKMLLLTHTTECKYMYRCGIACVPMGEARLDVYLFGLVIYTTNYL